jgi:hypothetical protein
MSGRDLARYTAFLMSAWPPRDDPDKGPVRRSSLREMQQAARFWELSADRLAPGAPLRAFAWGYGYGVNIVQTCRFRVVGHPGGVPGFGSNMRWLPDRGVGIFLLANRTYVEFFDVALETFERLAATGALPPNVVQPSPALLAARDRVVGLVDRWDDAVAAELAAGNLFLDQPAPARRDQLSDLRRIHGTCRPAGEMENDSALRGRWRMACERGFLTISVALAPTQPPKVQVLEVKSSPPLSEPLRTTVTKLASLGSAWDEAAADGLFAPTVDRGRLRATLSALGAAYGACHADEALEGDGRTKARIRFACDRGAIIVDLVAGSDGRLLEPTFAQPPGTSCVP